MSAECHRCGWDLPYEGECVRCELEHDLYELGNAFAEIFSQALNGVVCEPGQTEVDRHHCEACNTAWKRGGAVLDKYDKHWAGLLRPRMFMPGHDERGRLRGNE